MIRVDPSNWTADFRIARALSEAYESSGFDDLVFFCVSDPDHEVGRFGTLVADETVKYFPNVLGLSDDPITPENVASWIERLPAEWPDAFVVAIEAGLGRSAHLGSVEITDRPLSSVEMGVAPIYFADVTVNAVLRLVEVSSPGDAGGSGTDSGAGGTADEDPVAKGPASQDVAGRAPGAGAGTASAGARARRAARRGLQEAVLEVGSDDEPAAGKKRFTPLRPEQINANTVRKIADVVIDGNLRFLSRIGKQEL